MGIIDFCYFDNTASQCDNSDIVVSDRSVNASATYTGNGPICKLWTYTVSIPAKYNGRKVTWYGNPDSTFIPTPIISFWHVTGEQLAVTRSSDNRTAIVSSSLSLEIGFRDIIQVSTVILKGTLFVYGNGTYRGVWNYQGHGPLTLSL